MTLDTSSAAPHAATPPGHATLPVIPDVPGPLAVKLEAVQQLVRARGAMVIDAREPDEFAAGHIPGAISIPYEAAGGEPERLQALDSGGRPILVYCSGGTCESSRMLAEMLVRDFGKRRVLVYEGGFPEWASAGNPVETGAK
jgi:rhodanese-related sulfurtransferase